MDEDFEVSERFIVPRSLNSYAWFFSKLLQISGGSRIFPGGGGANSQSRLLTYFSGRKLHENERIWTPGGASPGAPLRSATANCYKYEEVCPQIFWETYARNLLGNFEIIFPIDLHWNGVHLKKIMFFVL